MLTDISAFPLTRKWNWLGGIMVMRCVMRHARLWNDKTWKLLILYAMIVFISQWYIYWFIYHFLVYINTAPEGTRVYDKRHSCFFCNKEYAKIARHLRQVHSNEEEVKTALSLPVNDKKRKNLFEKLGRMGNFNHNMRVLENKEGELKVVRRPTSETTSDPQNYLPCKYCHGFFMSNELCRHASKCPFIDEEEKGLLFHLY